MCSDANIIADPQSPMAVEYRIGVHATRVADRYRPALRKQHGPMRNQHVIAEDDTPAARVQYSSGAYIGTTAHDQ